MPSLSGSPVADFRGLRAPDYRAPTNIAMYTVPTGFVNNISHNTYIHVYMRTVWS
jgi:hypothetical protein